MTGEATIPASFLPDHTTLDHPMTTTALTARMNELTRQRMLSFAERAELACIWTLIDEGRVTAGQLREILVNFYWILPQSDAEFLAPVRKDQATAWQSLTAIVTGRGVKSAEAIEDSIDDERARELREGQATEWLRCTMLVLDTVAGTYNTLPDDYVADMLPSGLVCEIRNRAADQWFGSAYAVGESIEALPVGAASAFGMEGQGIYVVDALARAVLTALEEHSAAQNTSDQALALGRIDLWWMLLKGFTFSMLEIKPGGRLPARLVDHPEVTERICAALQQAFAILRVAGEASVDHTPCWSGTSSAPSSMQTTDDLIAHLHTRLAQEQAEKNRTHR